ncbi:Translation machinery-associated protein 22 [Tulasnella sp. JGI-2019a]|nr:Translation machinery-associated protein 22 [Tulasnella sp. JGI-2019a]
MAEVATAPGLPEAPAPLTVLYCEICSLPPEYCEFGSHATRCKTWLEETHPDLYQKYYSDDALQSKVSALSIEAQSKLEKDTAKKEAKAEAKAEAEAKKKQAAKVTIKRIERNKRKYVTSIHGLETFGIDLKKAAKQFATKFATGSSVTKNAQGFDEIVVQGDVSDDILEIIEDAATGGGGQLGNLLKAVPADNVVCIEEKKKKDPPPA